MTYDELVAARHQEAAVRTSEKLARISRETGIVTTDLVTHSSGAVYPRGPRDWAACIIPIPPAECRAF